MRLICPVRKPRPSGLYGNIADPELADVGSISSSGIAAPERILGLQRRDGVHRVGPANRSAPASDKPR